MSDNDSLNYGYCSDIHKKNNNSNINEYEYPIDPKKIKQEYEYPIDNKKEIKNYEYPLNSKDRNKEYEYPIVTSLIQKVFGRTGCIEASSADYAKYYQTLNPILSTISSLNNTSTGLIKLINGIASLDANTYLTGNQSINWNALGDVSGSSSGTTSISPSLIVTGIQDRKSTRLNSSH